MEIPSARRQAFRPLPVLLVAILFASVLAIPVSASLGSDLSSVHRDAVHADGEIRVTSKAQYSIYELKISTGTRVREFISAEGLVFAVAWDGPFLPEFQQFLGSNFQKYTDALHVQKLRYFSRKPVLIRLNDLVFESSGHVGAFWGRAYIPQAVPPGVAITELY